MENYIAIELGSSFLLNAGIVGFIEFLKSNDAEEDEDYIIKGQTLYVSRNYFAVNDISQMYVNTMATILGESTYLIYMLNKKESIEKLITNEISGEDSKKVLNYYKDFSTMLNKNSFKSGYEIAKKYDNLKEFDINLLNKFSKEEDLNIKKLLLEEICCAIRQTKLLNILIFKELMYSKIKLFFEGTSFFLPANLNLAIDECYKKDFYQPFLDEINTTKAKNKRCIECAELSNTNKAISFMIDTTDDVARKKSAYWNCKPDAFVCPSCALMYTFVPLGFHFLGQDAVFVNNNTNIESITSMMNTYRNKTQNEPKQSSFMAQAYKAFIMEKSEMLENKTNSSIQVIVKGNKSNHYQFSIISKDKIQKLSKCKKYLERLDRIRYKIGNDWINIYDEVFNNIIYNRSQYGLIIRTLKAHLNDNSNTNYMENILYIQIYFKGGTNVEDIKKNVDVAFAVGKDMRYKVTDATTEKEVDDGIRGLVYKLTNALSVCNIDDYINVVIRIYSGKGLPIPYIFKEMYLSDEQFKAIGTGFILGLKYIKYVSKNNNNENEGN